MTDHTPTGSGNPGNPGNPGADPGGSFDLGAHLAGLMIYAMDDPDRAGPLGWLVIYAVKGARSLPLESYSRGHASLPDGAWKQGSDPRALMEALPVFGIEHAGAVLTEPHELTGLDWQSPDHHFALFDAMADRLPFIVQRAEAYWGVIQDWYAAPERAPGTDKVLRQYAALYNAGLYYEAYKLLEMRWMVEPEPGRDLLRGLMQLSVGLHQVETGKFAMQQLEEAYGRIRTGKAAFGYPTIERFIKRLEKATRLIKAHGPDGYQKFDLRMFPKMWFASPWKILWGRMRQGL
ncbi:MAG: DUF309 domain-containing protein [Nitrospirae bacterium]|nr:DUF309 domain-containing protein [Nitrospirota bacterium]